MKEDQDKHLAESHDLPAAGQNSEPTGTIPRRTFLSRGLAAAGSLMAATGIGSPLWSKTSYRPKLETVTLRSQYHFRGKVLQPSDPEFNQVVFGGLWNELRPSRAPQMVLQVEDEQDVAAAVKYARAAKLKVSIRGGGHNWCNPSVRNSGIMIDLSKLNKVISIDAENRRAVVQPIISNREIQAYLNPKGLSYPSGHCPPVKLSGYLLSGGMAWNQGVWGPGCGSLEAIEMVTARGELITASAAQNQDYFWAARGAGPGLFAVAVRYHLKLYPLPKAITASVYYYPYDRMLEIADWLGPLAARLPNTVELSLFLVTAPADLAEICKSTGGKVCMVTATCFAETYDEAQAALDMLDDCPIIDRCLSKTTGEPTDFEKLFDASGALWPANLRCKVDALFSDANISDVLKPVQEHFLSASPKTVLMFALFTGANVPAPPLDTAFSMTGRLYGGPWTQWTEAAADADNIAWHDKCLQLLKPNTSGHYVAETDTVGHPEYLTESYKPANWSRLAELRKKYDPEGVFFAYSDGLA